MSVRRPVSRSALALLLAAALPLAGCALAWTIPRSGGHAHVPPGRVLVVPRGGDEQQRALAQRAADTLAWALRGRHAVVRTRELVAGAGWITAPVERVERGAWPTLDERAALVGELGVQTIIAVALTEYDQVWGKYGKFTRVGVEARAFDVGEGAERWRLHGDAEVEDKRGRAFQYAVEQAVQHVADAISPEWRLSLGEAWRAWRR